MKDIHSFGIQKIQTNLSNCVWYLHKISFTEENDYYKDNDDKVDTDNVDDSDYFAQRFEYS